MAKMHGWLVGALADRGYQQRDLAKAWRVDDAVVSRFIATGKPDLTPERQMLLSKMLGMTNDQLLARLYGEMPLPKIIQLRPPPVPVSAPMPAPASRREEQQQQLKTHRDDAVDAVHRAIEHLEALLGPTARVSIHIDFNKRSER
jgi:hypothetical protein